jgi:hypothetical protein
VAHLLQQHLMAFQRRLEVARAVLALDRHAENVGGALQESDVLLDELLLRAAVDLSTPNGRPSRCRMTYDEVDARAALASRGAEALLVLEMVGDHGLAGAERKAGG